MPKICSNISYSNRQIFLGAAAPMLHLPRDGRYAVAMYIHRAKKNFGASPPPLLTLCSQAQLLLQHSFYFFRTSQRLALLSAVMTLGKCSGRGCRPQPASLVHLVQLAGALLQPLLILLSPGVHSAARDSTILAARSYIAIPFAPVHTATSQTWSPHTILQTTTYHGALAPPPCNISRRGPRFR